MIKSTKILLCIILCALIVLSACGCDGNNSQNSATASATQQTTNILTTAPSTSTDANAANQPATYNYVRLKEKTDAIIADFNKYISDYRFKGTVYYKLGNDFEYISKSGMADYDAHKENSIDTAYYVGSITKQFTAAAVMLLTEQNKLSLDDTLDKFYPKATQYKSVTIKNLLSMTSGIKSYMCSDGYIDADVYSKDELEFNISKDNSAKENKSEILKWILSQDLLFEPDSSFSFSDSNYYLLGDIIEKVSGKFYESFLSENIFKPVAMDSTSFSPSKKLAVGYQYGGEYDWIHYKGVGYSSSGMITTVSDILKWVYALDENKVISKESLDQMFTPYKNGYGFGMFVNNDKASQLGKSCQFGALLVYTRNEEEVYVAFTNYSRSDTVQLYSLFRKSINPFYG